jgi:putative hemolysin
MPGETIPLAPANELISIAIVLAAIGLVAFFSSSEAALISVSKLRIRAMAERGVQAAQIVLNLTRQPGKLFATILLSENFFIIFATSFGTALAMTIVGEQGYIVASIVMTILVVIVGEITPKTFAAQFADRWSLAVARPMYIVTRVLTPIVWVFSGIAGGLVRLLGGKGIEKTPFVTEEEIRMLISISEAEGIVEERERRMLHAVFRFGDRPAHSIMVPRTEIEYLPSDASLQDLLELFQKTGHTRFPVIGQNLDDVLGIVNVKDLFLKFGVEADLRSQKVAQLMRPAYFTPESKTLGELLTEMQAAGVTMAILVDEYGGTSGLLTLEDIIEEIVGQLRDEFEAAERRIEEVEPGHYSVDAHTPIEEVSEALGIEIPSGEYRTVAGFVMAELGRVPIVGDEVVHNGVRFRVVRMDGLRVERVEIFLR